MTKAIVAGIFGAFDDVAKATAFVPAVVGDVILGRLYLGESRTRHRRAVHNLKISSKTKQAILKSIDAAL